MVRTVALALLLAGCAHPVDILRLEEPDAKYVPPLTRAKYAYLIHGYTPDRSAHGFYVDRDIQVSDNGEITYKVLFDNRPVRDFLLKEYQPDQEFKDDMPSFIGHAGTADCNGNNTYTLTRYGEKFKVLKQENKIGVTEVSQALCLHLQLTRNKE